MISWSWHRVWLWGWFCVLGLAGLSAQAHEMTMAEMEVRQLAPSEFLWSWTASGNRPPGQELTPSWPAGCRSEQNALRCGPDGLQGTLTIDGVGKRYSAVLVKVLWQDGESRVYTLTSAQPKVILHGGANDTRSLSEIAGTYGVLGIEHILSGIDHLLFVIGLLFLVGFERRLVWTISAFTLAHSLTLVSSALGWLTLRQAPVEACIALSIVLVAAESLHRRETWARRWPALVAFLFGLVHGLGFAGALREVGLPDHHLVPALLAFNVGVELGQLGVVLLAWGLVWLLSKVASLSRSRTPLLYGIGGVAAYWSWLRVAALLA
jgi:hypothetical protein